MEPVSSTDEYASQGVRSKIAFFQSNVGNSEEKSTSLPLKDTVVIGGSFSTLHTRKPDRFGKTFDEESRTKFNEVQARKSSGFSDMEIFKRPMCLMRTVEREKELDLEMSRDTADQISQIDWPLVIVAVVGLYRTGKSYLMNQLAGSKEGFTVGDTIESATKGIWAWCKFHPDKENTVLLLIDTEGLGNVEMGDPRHDNKIFTIAALLCNCLVYNIKGAFDQDAVSKLTFVTEIAKNIRFKGGSSTYNDNINLVLPDFVLCVRDFSLKLSKGGKEMSEDEYLEHGLAKQEDRDETFNKPRECIRKFFKVRRCFTFPVPGDADVLENLGKLPLKNLSSKFRKATKRFVCHIYSLQPKDILASKPINGQMFIALADHYVSAIRQGAVPDVDDAFTAVAKTENSKISKEALEGFETQMGKITMPIPSRNLHTYYTHAQQTALNYLRENVVQDIDGKCEQQVQMEMDKFWNTLKEENTRKVREMCGVTLQATYKASMEEKVEKRTYEVAGGHRNFRRDLTEMKSDYMFCLRDYEEHEVLLSWLGFKKTLKEKEANIIAMDNELSAKEKEDERERYERQIASILKYYEESRAKALQEQKKALKNHYEKLHEDREKKYKRDMAKIESLLRAKLEEERAEEKIKLLQREKERKSKWVGARVWNAIWNH